MAERPVVVAAGAQVGELARRVAVVPRMPGQRSVQDADIEGVRDRGRVGDRQVFGGCGLGEAPSVERDTEPLEPEALGLAASETVHVRRPWDAAGEHGSGVMVAIQDTGGDAGLLEAPHRASE